MIPRKPLAPNNGAPKRSLRSEFAYQPFPKAIEEQSILSWASPGKSADGNAISGGAYRTPVIRRQFGTR